MTKRARTGYQIALDKTTAALKALVADNGKAEYRLHCQIVEAVERLKVPSLVFWHTANEGKRTPAQAAAQKAMGLRAGVSDLVFSLPQARMMFMEIKSLKGKLSPEQRVFFDSMTAHGHIVCVVRSLDEGLHFLTEFGAIRAARVAA